MLQSTIDVEKLDKSVSSTRETNVGQTALVCPKCDALKIAKSRSKGFDGLLMRFIPRRPYRCLHCYHRFWSAEKFTEDNRRIWSWAVVLIASVLTLFMYMY